MNVDIIHNYRNDPALRASFNLLAREVFGLDFEEWYRNGFFSDDYDPYSVFVCGRAVANISVNRCDMIYDGGFISLIQLGTVMTHPDFRGRGYARAIMEKILSEYEGKVDGIYLFSNDSAKPFYTKFGFSERKEYGFFKSVSNTGGRTAKATPLRNKSDFERAANIIGEREPRGRLHTAGNTGLYMFYLSRFMRENFYYLPEYDTYVIAEEEKDNLIHHAIFGECTAEDAAAAFGREIKDMALRFTPDGTSGFTVRELEEEDTTLFVKGRFFERTKGDRFRFPETSRA